MCLSHDVYKVQASCIMPPWQSNFLDRLEYVILLRDIILYLELPYVSHCCLNKIFELGTGFGIPVSTGTNLYSGACTHTSLSHSALPLLSRIAPQSQQKRWYCDVTVVVVVPVHSVMIASWWPQRCCCNSAHCFLRSPPPLPSRPMSRSNHGPPVVVVGGGTHTRCRNMGTIRIL